MIPALFMVCNEVLSHKVKTRDKQRRKDTYEDGECERGIERENERKADIE